MAIVAVRRLCMLYLAIALAAGCGTRGATPRPQGEVQPPDLKAYQLGIGDRVRIDVYGEPDLSVDAMVDPSGQISYPLLGSIQAVKKTAPELQDLIASRLTNGYLISPDVRVNVIQYRAFYIIGQIRKPGAYPYITGLTVEKALALAGGLTPLGSTRRIFLLREGTPTEQRQGADLGTTVLPGDTLMVEEGLF